MKNPRRGLIACIPDIQILFKNSNVIALDRSIWLEITLKTFWFIGFILAMGSIYGVG